MGYYTSYSMEVINGNPDLIKQFREECDEARYSFDDEGNSIENNKWYKSNEDLKEFSKKHPEALLLLEGEGEDSPDFWREYWKNGKVQRIIAKIVYDEYDESKLE